MTHVTCRLTAQNRDQLRNPTLGNRVWTTFLLLHTQFKTPDPTPQNRLPPSLRVGMYEMVAYIVFLNFSDRVRTSALPPEKMSSCSELWLGPGGGARATVFVARRPVSEADVLNSLGYQCMPDGFVSFLDCRKE